MSSHLQKATLSKPKHGQHDHRMLTFSINFLPNEHASTSHGLHNPVLQTLELTTCTLCLFDITIKFRFQDAYLLAHGLEHCFGQLLTNVTTLGLLGCIARSIGL